MMIMITGSDRYRHNCHYVKNRTMADEKKEAGEYFGPGIVYKYVLLFPDILLSNLNMYIPNVVISGCICVLFLLCLPESLMSP